MASRSARADWAPSSIDAAWLTEQLRASRLTVLCGDDISMTPWLREAVLPRLQRRAADRWHVPVVHAGNVLSFPDRRLAPVSNEVCIYFADWAERPQQELTRALREAVVARGTDPEAGCDLPLRLADKLRALARGTDLRFLVVLDRFDVCFDAAPERRDLRSLAREVFSAINEPDVPAQFLLTLHENGTPLLEKLRGHVIGFDAVRQPLPSSSAAPAGRPSVARPVRSAAATAAPRTAAVYASIEHWLQQAAQRQSGDGEAARPATPAPVRGLTQSTSAPQLEVEAAVSTPTLAPTPALASTPAPAPAPQEPTPPALSSADARVTAPQPSGPGPVVTMQDLPEPLPLGGAKIGLAPSLAVEPAAALEESGTFESRSPSATETAVTRSLEVIEPAAPVRVDEDPSEPRAATAVDIALPAPTVAQAEGTIVEASDPIVFEAEPLRASDRAVAVAQPDRFERAMRSGRSTFQVEADSIVVRLGKARAEHRDDERDDEHDSARIDRRNDEREAAAAPAEPGTGALPPPPAQRGARRAGAMLWALGGLALLVGAGIASRFEGGARFAGWRSPYARTAAVVPAGASVSAPVGTERLASPPVPSASLGETLALSGGDSMSVQMGEDLSRALGPAAAARQIAPSEAGWAADLSGLQDGTRWAIARYDALQAARIDGRIGPLRIVMPLATQELAFMVRADSPLQYIHEIEGRRINLGPADGARALTVRNAYRNLFGQDLPLARASLANEPAALEELLHRSSDVVVLVGNAPVPWARAWPEMAGGLRLLKLAPDHPSTRRALRGLLATQLDPGPEAGPNAAVTPTLAVMSFLVTGAADPALPIGVKAGAKVGAEVGAKAGENAAVAPPNPLARLAQTLCAQLPALQRDGHPKWREVQADLQLEVGWPYAAEAERALRGCATAGVVPGAVPSALPSALPKVVPAESPRSRGPAKTAQLAAAQLSADQLSHVTFHGEPA